MADPDSTQEHDRGVHVPGYGWWPSRNACARHFGRPHAGSWNRSAKRRGMPFGEYVAEHLRTNGKAFDAAEQVVIPGFGVWPSRRACAAALGGGDGANWCKAAKRLDVPFEVYVAFVLSGAEPGPRRAERLRLRRQMKAQALRADRAVHREWETLSRLVDRLERAEQQRRERAEKVTPLTPERLRELLHYDPETGVFIWRQTLQSDTKAWRYKAKQGARAEGHIAEGGYRHIYFPRAAFVDVETVPEHRLAFMYMLGRWPIDQVDHIDGNPGNNAWSNLRDADASLNMSNQDCVGVWYDRPKGLWVAELEWSEDGERKRHRKRFRLRSDAVKQRALWEVKMGYRAREWDDLRTLEQRGLACELIAMTMQA